MNMESYDQVAVPADLVGDQSVYLQPEMKVKLSVYEGTPVGIELPQRATLEVVETEPTVKGQTASVVLQAGRAVERRAHHGAPHITRRHAHRGDDRRRHLLERAKD